MSTGSFVPGPKPARSDMESSTPLPMTPEEITAPWLTSVLGVEVASAAVTSVVQGTSSKIFVEVVFADGVVTDIPTRLVVKGGFNPAIREAFPEMWATYRREAEFYQHVAPLTRMLLPQIWFVGTDTVNGQGLFIMSDVGHAATFGNPLEAWGADRVADGLAQLASLHGATWNSSEEKHSWLFGADGERRDNPVRTVIRALIQPEPWALRYDESCRPPVAPPHLDRARMENAYELLWKHADENTRLHCIIHGDNHVGNTFIMTDGTPGFIDWQCLQYESAMHDVTHFLIGAMDIEERRKHENSLLDGYLEALHAAGAPKFSRADIWDDYRRQALHGFLWALTPLKMQPDDVVFIMSERYSTAIVDYGTLELLEGKSS